MEQREDDEHSYEGKRAIEREMMMDGATTEREGYIRRPWRQVRPSRT
jgi:hypothetical protein